MCVSVCVWVYVYAYVCALGGLGGDDVLSDLHFVGCD